MLSKALWVGDHGYNTIYVMPTADVLSDFIHARVDPAIEESAYINSLVTGTDNVRLKQIRNAYAYFRAYLVTNPKQHKLKSVDADFMAYDEFDELGDNVRALGEKRLGHSALAWETAVSTPTYPDMGIDREVNQSDQRHWMIKCDHCNEWQELDFFKNVKFKWNAADERAEWVKVVCRKCGKDLDRLKKGEWVPKYPSRTHMQGYQINKLMCALTDMHKLVRNSKRTLEYEIKEFFNSDLGLAYTPKGGKLTRVDLLRCVGSWNNVKTDQFRHCWMGVDIGKRHNVIIGHEDKVVFACEIDDLMGEGGELMELFDVDTCVVDANPELHLARNFSEAHPGRVYLAYYWGQSDKKKEVFQIKEDEDDDTQTVHINRTAMGDFLIQGQIKPRKLKLPKDSENIQSFFDQLQAPTRVVEKDAVGNLVAKYVEYGKPDHYFHSLIYMLIARFITLDYELVIYEGNEAPERDTSQKRNYDTEGPGVTAKVREREESIDDGDEIGSIDRDSTPDW